MVDVEAVCPKTRAAPDAIKGLAAVHEPPGHIPGQGVEAIGDFSKRQYAEEAFQRITGIPFTGSYRADAHLRIMHAGPKLLEALRTVSEWIDAQHFVQRTLIQETIRLAIAEATGRR